jgi:UPF0271 protein
VKIDLNADVGEGDDDLPLYALVSSVNVACGEHAGDDDSMMRAMDLAKAHRIAVGAHPGYSDRANKGRVSMDLPPSEVRALLLSQLERLSLIARRHRMGLAHVKPHGALYNDAATDLWLAATIARTVKEAHPMLRLVGLARSFLPIAGRAAKLAVAEEGFADRRYRSDGTLAPRGTADALITDPEQAAAQALSIARGVAIDAVDGGSVSVTASTICLHADTPGAIDNARAVRGALEKAGFTIGSL